MKVALLKWIPLYHRCTTLGMENVEAPGDGVVTGYGTIDGRLVFALLKILLYWAVHLENITQKIVKVQNMALKMGAPIIGLNDSVGKD